MSSLQERLREYAVQRDKALTLSETCREAADRIDALEAALREIDDYCTSEEKPGSIAREALGVAAKEPNDE